MSTNGTMRPNHSSLSFPLLRVGEGAGDVGGQARVQQQQSPAAGVASLLLPPVAGLAREQQQSPAAGAASLLLPPAAGVGLQQQQLSPEQEREEKQQEWERELERLTAGERLFPTKGAAGDRVQELLSQRPTKPVDAVLPDQPQGNKLVPMMPCGGCAFGVGGIHACPICTRHMHPFCGTAVGPEGYGQAAMCSLCFAWDKLKDYLITYLIPNLPA